MGLPVLYTLHCPYVIKETTEPERRHITTFHITQLSHHYPLTFRIFHYAFYVMHYTTIFCLVNKSCVCITQFHILILPTALFTHVPTSNRCHTTLRKSSCNVMYRPQTSSINFVSGMYLIYVKCILIPRNYTVQRSVFTVY